MAACLECCAEGIPEAELFFNTLAYCACAASECAEVCSSNLCAGDTLSAQCLGCILAEDAECYEVAFLVCDDDLDCNDMFDCAEDRGCIPD